jgi:hypothetical protein
MIRKLCQGIFRCYRQLTQMILWKYVNNYKILQLKKKPGKSTT